MMYTYWKSEVADRW